MYIFYFRSSSSGYRLQFGNYGADTGIFKVIMVFCERQCTSSPTERVSVDDGGQIGACWRLVRECEPVGSGAHIV